ncbi:unnamed protein product [Umbelopsis sp. WA50703]
MDDVESNDSIEGLSIDESTSDNQSQLVTDGLPRTRWLSERFHFSSDVSDTDDEFDVDKWPSFAPIATSIDDLILDDRKESNTSEVNANEDVDSPSDTGLEFISLDSPSSGQHLILQDTKMGEASIDIVRTDEQAKVDRIDIPACKEKAKDGEMTDINTEISRSKSLDCNIHSKSVLKSPKTKVSQKEGKKPDGPLSPFRKLISSPTKKPVASSEANTEDDETLTRFGPMTQQEKRRRQAKRAEQLKFWRVREEREAREARLASRREALEGRSSNAKRAAPAETPSPLRKAVKFNLKRNRVIQFNDES